MVKQPQIQDTFIHAKIMSVKKCESSTLDHHRVYEVNQFKDHLSWRSVTLESSGTREVPEGEEMP